MIQDLITSSRRMASLYRFRFIQPAHLLYSLTGNETGRELVSKNGFDVCLLRAAMIREFKSYASQIRDPNNSVEPSELFDKCCEAHLLSDEDAPYEDGLQLILDTIQYHQDEDRIVSIALREANMKGTVEEPVSEEVDFLPDLDELLEEEMARNPDGLSVKGFQPSDPLEKGPGDENMHSVFDGEEDKRAKSEREEKKPAQRLSKEADEVRAAVKAAQRDLSSLAKTGKLDPVIGRDQEINHVIEILMRRRKPNVILVAEPGVGKTALVEGLANRLAVQGAVDKAIYDRPLKEVSLTGLVAGTRFRGDFEARMSVLISEAEKDRSILFIDEIHMIMGSGAVARGGMDGANILKPALARDGLSVIGATTPEEALILREDSALMRRFELIHLNEPQREQMEVILKGASSSFLEGHKVKISLAMQGRLLDFGERYLPYRRNPDRSFDLLDLAAVSARLRGASKISEIDLRHGVRRLGGDLPLDKSNRAAANLQDLPSYLRSKVKGQDEAISDFVTFLQLSEQMGGHGGVCRISGPEGVGKTFLLECLARHSGKRMTSVRYEPHRPDGVDLVWARIVMALEADASAIIALQNGNAELAGEINKRVSSELQGGARLASALRTPSIFCLESSQQAAIGFGFQKVDATKSEDQNLILMSYATEDHLEDLVEAVIQEIRQLQKDSGDNVGCPQLIRMSMSDSLKTGQPTYGSLRKAALEYYMRQFCQGSQEVL